MIVVKLKKEAIYNTDRFNHLISEASFDGWIENDGPNADVDEKCQLLREDRAHTIIAEARSELLLILNSGEPQTLIEYSYDIVKWFEKWFHPSTDCLKETGEQK